MTEQAQLPEIKFKDFAPPGMSEEEKDSLLSMNLTDTFRTIAKNLAKFHGIFKQLWQLGEPRLTFEIPTAAVSFDKEGNQVLFLFNPLFWNGIDEYTREFVICHECLHVILNHGLRTLEIETKKNHEIANKSMDIVINHMLVDKFNFDRYSIKDQHELCWIDTCFKENHRKIERQRAFEYYFGLMKNISDTGGRCLDIHDFFRGMDFEKVFEKLNDIISDIEKDDFIGKIGELEECSKEAGNGSLGSTLKITKRKFKKQKKWETVIQRWSMKFRSCDIPIEQWSRKSRRMYSLDNNIILPCDFDDEKFEQAKIDVWFFLDASGSCIHLKDRFFGAAKSLPADRFHVTAFSFDTEVFPVNLDHYEIKGGGGTSFSILEDEVQKYLKADPLRKHPEAIFVITDGYGNKLNPSMPKKWYFFLSENYRSCIPQTCNIFKLKDFA